MSSSLTQEQKNNIRKSLPLKIFERREDAVELARLVEFFHSMLHRLMMIEDSSGDLHIQLSGSNLLGEEVVAGCFLATRHFKELRKNLAEIVKGAIERYGKELDEIPNAKIITVDFKNKKIDPATKPEPLFRPEYDQLPNGTTAIYQGAWNICKALDMGFISSDIPNLVKEKGLPAFKANGKKHWYALNVKLMLWKQKAQRRGDHA
jgi:hypothetical protein